ncbi:MAG: SDR family oxidoreductase [Cyanobacteria bacterium P01_F01_bin.3]
MNTLSNKVAIVTGASTGIGYVTAKLFAEEGAAVVVAARRQKELDELVDSIYHSGGCVVALAGDVKNEEFAKALVDIAVKEFGGLDIAFNNAGITGNPGAATDISLDEWNTVLATNLTSAFLGAKYQLPAMIDRGGGSLIFTSSFVGYTVGMSGMSPYAASKSGLIGFMKVLASEYGSQKIRVNALLPGGTDTPMGRDFTNTPETMTFVQNLHALKRMATPHEIALSALYLASDVSSFTTGSAMLVDGGVSININTSG